MPKTRIVAIIGESDSGKTVLITKLIGRLTRSGAKVAVLKHSHEETLDLPGKDTYRFSEAGAAAVYGVSRSGIVTIERTRKIRLERIISRITSEKGTKIDWLLIEGFSKEVHGLGIPTVVVGKSVARVEEIVKDNRRGNLLFVTGINFNNKDEERDSNVVAFTRAPAAILKQAGTPAQSPTGAHSLLQKLRYRKTVTPGR